MQGEDNYDDQSNNFQLQLSYQELDIQSYDDGNQDPSNTDNAVGAYETTPEHIQELIQKIRDALHEISTLAEQTGKCPLSNSIKLISPLGSVATLLWLGVDVRP